MKDQDNLRRQLQVARDRYAHVDSHGAALGSISRRLQSPAFRSVDRPSLNLV